MATLREYFDADFDYAVRVNVDFPLKGGEQVEGAILYDFAGLKSFLACYVPNQHVPFEYFMRIAESLEYGKKQVVFRHQLKLPTGRYFPGRLQVKNENPLDILAN